MELTSFLDTKWSNTKPVPGTHKVSQGSDSVQVSDTTDGVEARVCVIHTTTTTQKELSEQDKQEDNDEASYDWNSQLHVPFRCVGLRLSRSHCCVLGTAILLPPRRGGTE